MKSVRRFLAGAFALALMVSALAWTTSFNMANRLHGHCLCLTGD
ncbi:hypothetical protein [Kozakia baliensis]|nr:hypothetical protein [Kozakia baliensis]